MCIDKTNMFEDFNFKLIVIDSLLNKEPSFKDELDALKQKFTYRYEWYNDEPPIQEILDYCAQLVFQQSDLNQVTELCFDGGNHIYHIIKPDWEGEDGDFNVTSIKGFEQLSALKSVVYISMCSPEVLDPMREKGIEIK